MADSRLTLLQKGLAKYLSTLILKKPAVNERIAELQTNQDTTLRELICFKKLPRVSTADIVVNAPYIEVYIGFDDDGDQRLLLSTTFMQFIFWSIGAKYMHQLSAQSSALDRSSWSRWESDKSRLVWAYFMRQRRRSEFSNDVVVFKLKQLYLQKKARLRVPALPAPLGGGGGGGGGAALPATPPLVAPDAAAPLLLDLPDFPSLMDVDDDAEAASPLKKCADVVCVTSSDSDGEKAELLIPMGGIVEEDSYLALPEGFADPLPEPLAIGLPVPKGLKRPAPPGGIADLKATLQNAGASSAKKHFASVNKKAQAASVLKKPAGAILKRPAAQKKDGKKTEKADEKQMHKELLRKCVEACTDKAKAGQVGEVRLTFQRKTNIYQVYDPETKRAVCQTTDKQLGTADKAKYAAEVLAELYTLGASKGDLQRVKQAGCFGHVIGRPLHLCAI